MSNEIQTADQTPEQIVIAPRPAAPAPDLRPYTLQFMKPGLVVASDPAARQGLQFIAKLYHDGACLPEGLTPQGAIILMLAGVDYNLSPIEAISKLYLIAGRVTPSAHELVAQALRGGVRIDVLESTHELARIKLQRDGATDLTYEYTKADAQKAGRWGSKGPWTNDPRSMLMAACKRQALRLFSPDLLSNMYDADEVSGGNGTLDDAGNFTPDPSITGDRPAVKVEAFVGPKVTQEVKPKASKAKAEPAPAPAPEPAPEPAPAAVSITEAIISQVVVPGTEETDKDGRTGGEIDRSATVQQIATRLTEQFGKAAAGTMIKARLQNEYSVVKSADLTILQIMAMVKWTDQVITDDRLKKASENDVPAFNPAAGAGTKSKTSQIADGVKEDFDAQILEVFYQYGDLDLDATFSAIVEEYAYDETSSSEQVKRLTLKALREGLNASAAD